MSWVSFNIYVSNHIVPNEFWLFHRIILNLRELVNGIQRVGISDSGKLIQFGSGPLNIINGHAELLFVDLGRNEDPGDGFGDIIVAIVKGLTGFDGFFDELGSCSWYVIDLHCISYCSFGSDIFLCLQSGQIHGVYWLLEREIIVIHMEFGIVFIWWQIDYINKISWTDICNLIEIDKIEFKFKDFRPKWDNRMSFLLREI